MNKQAKSYTLEDYMAILSRRRWQLLVPMVVVFSIVAYLAVSLPPKFRSYATILIEQQEIPEELVRSTVTGYADQRIQVISQRVMTTANLSRIVEEYDLYSVARNKETMASIVDRMQEDIHLDMVSAEVVDPRSGRPKQATIAFTLGFDSESPTTAQKVANEIVSLFLNENVKQRREVAKEATEFLSDEARKLSEEISDLEAKLSVLKEQHADSLPDMRMLNLDKLERLEGELRNNNSQMNALEERIIYLLSELAEIQSETPLYTGKGERIMSPVERLKALETEYLAVASRYTSAHPDRIKLEKEIAALKATVGGSNQSNTIASREAELAAMLERYSPSHPDVRKLQNEINSLKRTLDITEGATQPVSANTDVRKSNPAYIRIAAQLQAAQSEKRSLKENRGQINLEIDELEKTLAEGPKIEREFLSLTRKYEAASSGFSNMRAKQMEAELSESLEAESKAEKFVLIEPPLAPETPFEPNRLAILLFGVVISTVAGLGHVALREMVDDTIHGFETVRAVAGVSPIAAISYIQTKEDLVKQRTRNLFVVMSLVALVAVVLFTVHNYYRPLDTLYFSLLK